MLLLFLISSCELTQPENNKQQYESIIHNKIVKLKPDTSITNFYDKISFEREDGRFLKYFCEEDKLLIKYGNNTFEKTMKDTFSCAMPYVGTPMLWEDNEDFIFLSFGCGSPCWGIFVLPLNKRDTSMQFLYHYDYNKENNILIHLDYYEPKDKYVLMARNLLTNSFEVINIQDCNSTFLGYCIDSLNLNGNQLFVQSRTAKEMEKGFKTKGSQITRKKIKL